MARLHVDIETYSDVDIKTGGLYKYVQSPSFQILLVAYAMDDEPVRLIDLINEPMPEALLLTLKDNNITKVAHNAAFEATCFAKAYGIAGLAQWECTSLMASYCGYPASLEKAGNALGLGSDKAKLATGKALIKYFCVPCKPTRTNGGRTRNLPHHDVDKWDLFKAYCVRDVEAEREIDKRLSAYPLPATEWIGWNLDYQMNSGGIGIDYDMAVAAVEIDERIAEETRVKAEELTGLDNPKSTKQMLDWLYRETGETVESIRKDRVDDLIANLGSDKVAEALTLRQLLTRTSTAKYKAMLDAVGEDSRVRGVLQYYGAGRSGRWAGRLVQVQNLPRNKMEDLDLPRRLIKERNVEALKFLYGDVPDVLSQLIRTAFIPKPGHTFVVADYSAIEARVIAWLAGERWRLDVFNSHGKIYEASASAMFGVDLDLIKPGNPEYALRQKGKIAELALGYQGGVGALKTMGALAMGLNEEELPDIVSRWRCANKAICSLWYSTQDAAMQAVAAGQRSKAGALKQIGFRRDSRHLMVGLPSGREIFYVEPALIPGQYGDQLSYMGVQQMTRKWERIPTYGGKLVENITQAVARDCLAELLQRMYRHDMIPVMHIHDEVVYEVPEGRAESLLALCLEEMARPIDWAPGLPLKGAGFISPYYKKD